MQKEFINGVPYYVDKEAVYTADEYESIAIGKYTEKLLEFHANHLEKLQDRLKAWRAEQTSRVRKPTAPSARKSRNAKAGVTEVSDNDA